MGSVEECQNQFEQPFQTRFCTIHGHLKSNRIELVYGLCVPKTCTTSDLKTVFIMLGLFQSRWITTDIRCLESRSLDSSARLTMYMKILQLTFVDSLFLERLFHFSSF